MPIHNWTDTPSGLYHEFHQSWSVLLKMELNRGLLPEGYYAMVEQRTGTPEADLIALQVTPRNDDLAGSLSTLVRPKTKLSNAAKSDTTRYAEKANRISVRNPVGEVVAVIEIVSPGNKHSRKAVTEFVQKAWDLLAHGIHLVVIDLFPATPRDPNSLHGLIYEGFTSDEYTPPPEYPLTFVSYCAASELEAYIEPCNYGDELFPMPLFLTTRMHIPLPLEETYTATWNATPAPIKKLVLNPVANELSQ